MKKVQGKKKRDAAVADREREALKARKEAEGEDADLPPVESGDTGGADLLASKDEDVIF